MPDQDPTAPDELEGTLQQLRALPRPAMDFSTPEGAILCLEDAYRRRDIEAAVACKDFMVEAVLLLQETMPEHLSDREILVKTAEVLEAGFRKELSTKWPQMEGLESFFVDRQPGFQDLSIVVVTEISRMPDGTLAQSRLRVGRREDVGWRVLNVLDEQEPEEQPQTGRVQRHEDLAAVAGLPEGQWRYDQTIRGHIEACWGNCEVLCEDAEQFYVRLRVYLVRPTSERPFYTLITSGMSDRPMTVPQGAEEYRLAELVISLPANWRIDKLNSQDERHCWPLRWLIDLARLPHQYGTWLFAGHTVPNGDPPTPFAPDTKFCCLLLASPALCSEAGDHLLINDETTVHFHSVIPIYRKEMEFALSHSSDELLERLGNAEASELLHPGRRNVCA